MCLVIYLQYGVKMFVITSFKDTCYIEILPNVERSKRGTLYGVMISQQQTLETRNKSILVHCFNHNLLQKVLHQVVMYLKFKIR